LPDGETFHVRSDGARLRQILLNLVGNAVKFTSDGKIEVIIEANSDAAGTRICVKDSGIGIAQPDLNRIFDDFVTLDPSFSRRSSGTGLGLGIVRRIVRQMDGRLQVESQLGVGSTFSVYLPLSRLGAPEAAEDLPSRAATGPALSVLVVEDNEFNRVIVTEFLRHDGHEVEEAADAESGIDMAAGRHFDVILMDISMPGMDGLQAAGVIRAGQGESRATPIIAMTAHALPEDRARFRAGGMAVVLTKPITRESLRRALRDAVQDHEEKSGPPVMNRAILEGLGQDLGQERAEKLLGAFRAELGTLGGKVLAAASGKSDVVETARLAHQLAGSASMFGATALAEVLHLVESAWRANTALAPEVKARLVNVLAETEAAYQDADFAQPSSLR
jgi:CheY-like chemotaxis protein/HPt (histidine-containing phosphotransfer) domain-containing protein/anti-sigma regulatory factor (Ser/Thr protein kinase)